jgi:hypothetical protein
MHRSGRRHALQPSTEKTMNRGDFGHVSLPKTFKIVSSGKYQIVNGFTSPAGAGCALGTFSGSVPAGLNFKIPQAVLDQLKNEGLVTTTTVDLYDAARNPSSSPANLSRYMSLLQRLAMIDVDDGP